MRSSALIAGVIRLIALASAGEQFEKGDIVSQGIESSVENARLHKRWREGSSDNLDKAMIIEKMLANESDFLASEDQVYDLDRKLQMSFSFSGKSAKSGGKKRKRSKAKGKGSKGKSRRELRRNISGAAIAEEIFSGVERDLTALEDYAFGFGRDLQMSSSFSAKGGKNKGGGRKGGKKKGKGNKTASKSGKSSSSKRRRDLLGKPSANGQAYSHRKVITERHHLILEDHLFDFGRGLHMSFSSSSKGSKKKGKGGKKSSKSGKSSSSRRLEDNLFDFGRGLQMSFSSSKKGGKKKGKGGKKTKKSGKSSSSKRRRDLRGNTVVREAAFSHDNEVVEGDRLALEDNLFDFGRGLQMSFSSSTKGGKKKGKGGKKKGKGSKKKNKSGKSSSSKHRRDLRENTGIETATGQALIRETKMSESLLLEDHLFDFGRDLEMSFSSSAKGGKKKRKGDGKKGKRGKKRSKSGKSSSSKRRRVLRGNASTTVTDQKLIRETKVTDSLVLDDNIFVFGRDLQMSFSSSAKGGKNKGKSKGKKSKGKSSSSSE